MARLKNTKCLELVGPTMLPCYLYGSVVVRVSVYDTILIGGVPVNACAVNCPGAKRVNITPVLSF